jgi:hypothetical protein
MWPSIAYVAVLYWPKFSIYFGKFRQAPAKVRRASSECSVLLFNALLLFLGTASLLCVFLASFEASSKFCIFRQFFFSSSCFPVNLVS